MSRAGKLGIVLAFLYLLGGFFLIVPNPLWFAFFTLTVWGLWGLGATSLLAVIVSIRARDIEAAIVAGMFLLMGSIPYAITIRGCLSGDLNCMW